MARYLVTGGCGFIGSHLCEALIADGHQVSILDNLSTGKIENRARGSRLFVADAQDAQAVSEAMADCDGVFHLAAVASVERSNREWIATHAANQTATVTVLETARKLGGIPVVYASSAAIYGDNEALPLAECAAPRPLTAYGADKLGSELHARVAHLVHGVRTVGFRFFNVYGPRQDPKSPYSGVISIFADRLARGEAVTIFGDGQQVRDFVYVGDVVRFLIAGMKNTSAEAEVYNVCTGRPTTVLDVAQTIAGILDIEADIRFAPARAGDIKVSMGCPRKSAKELSVTARTPLHEGLALTLGIDTTPDFALAA
ncbi:MAG: NAD-dependent epimerase/dehydratase family protein [Geminicoccaceae bacterium]